MIKFVRSCEGVSDAVDKAAPLIEEGYEVKSAYYGQSNHIIILQKPATVKRRTKPKQEASDVKTAPKSRRTSGATKTPNRTKE